MKSFRSETWIIISSIAVLILIPLIHQTHAMTYPKSHQYHHHHHEDADQDNRLHTFAPAQLELRSRKPLLVLKDSKHTCGPDEHRCINGMCILSKWTCDSLDDCGDYSDERDCPPHRTGCPRDRFDCGNGQCITKEFMCDGDNDCLNAADETDCPSSSSSGKDQDEESNNLLNPCRTHEFRCRNLQCIQQHLVCNHETDCVDRSDEESCVYCNEDQFACKSRDTNRTLKCIPIKYVCDSVEDCDDGSDERVSKCPHPPSPRQQQSHAEKSSTKAVRGNHNSNEYYGSSSSNSYDHKSLAHPSSPSSHTSSTSGSRTKVEEDEKRKNDSSFTSLPSSLVFKINDAVVAGVGGGGGERGHDEASSISSGSNGNKDANDFPEGEEDLVEEENNDANVFDVCHPSQFRCGNGQCIPYNYRCDYRFHCRDGSDEEFCTPTIIQPFPYPVIPVVPVNAHSPHSHNSKNWIKGSPPKVGIDLKVYDTPQTQTAGHDVVFRCRDEGETRLPVKWSRSDGRVLSNNHKEEDGRLTLYEVSIEDAGIYVCSVLGSHPVISETAYLTVVPSKKGKKTDHVQEFRREKVTHADCFNPDDVCEGYQRMLQLVDPRKVDSSISLYKMCHSYKGSHQRFE